MRVLVMWCGMLVVTTARALTPNDFAEGVEVTPVGDAALQRVYLPGAVFRGATRTDLGDLRVFDRSGREVAFVLSVAAAPRTPAVWRAIQFFPLPDAFSPASPTSRVDVQVGAGGAIIAIRGGASHLAPVPGWLLDMSAWHAPVAELELVWTGGADNALVDLQVLTSDDLATWHIAVAHAALARLQYGGHAVVQNRIALPDVQARYVALQFTAARSEPASGAAFALTSVLGRAAVAPDGAANAIPEDELALHGVLVDGGVEYDAGARYPVREIALWPARTNDAIEVRLLTRDTAREKWRSLTQGIAYRVVLGGTTRLSQSLPVYGGGLRWLRVESVGGRFSNSSEIETHIRWPRPEVVFLRSGEAPFTVAFGAGGVMPVASPLPVLFQQLRAAQTAGSIAAAPDQTTSTQMDGVPNLDVTALPLARVGGVHVLGGDARRAPAPRPIPWQQIALWASLLLGVLVVGGMALRLLRASSANKG